MIINNNEEFELFYPYEKKYVKQYPYPKEYPCVCRWFTEGGGLMGEYRQVYVTYFPKDLTPEQAFLAGINAEWEPLG